MKSKSVSGVIVAILAVMVTVLGSISFKRQAQSVDTVDTDQEKLTED